MLYLFLVTLLGQICSLAAFSTLWSDYRYSTVSTNAISPTAMLAALKGKTMHPVQQSGDHCIRDDFFFYHADISPLLHRGEQCDAHEFYIALFSSLLSKSIVK